MMAGSATTSFPDMSSTRELVKERNVSSTLLAMAVLAFNWLRSEVLILTVSTSEGTRLTLPPVNVMVSVGTAASCKLISPNMIVSGSTVSLKVINSVPVFISREKPII